MEQNNNHNIYYLIVTVVLLIFVGIGLFMFFRYRTVSNFTGSNQTKNVINQIPSEVSNEPSFKLRLKNSQTTFRVGDQIILEVVANSNGQDVTGYDLIVGFDSAAVEFVSADSNVTDFSLFIQRGRGEVVLTGSKNLQVSSQNIFENKSLIDLKFKAISSGNFQIELRPQSGKRKSKLVDTTTKVYYPNLNTIQIQVLTNK